MNDSKKEFGKRLSEIRKSRKFKQKDIKEMIEAPTVQMISNWETGRTFPSSHYLIILAKKLDTSLDYLLLGKENNPGEKKIATYKDVCERIVELERCGLFYPDSYYNTTRSENVVTLSTVDKTMVDFRAEFDLLLRASKTMRAELFNQAVTDLLDKYDIPLKQKENKQTKK